MNCVSREKDTEKSVSFFLLNSFPAISFFLDFCSKRFPEVGFYPSLRLYLNSIIYCVIKFHAQKCNIGVGHEGRTIVDLSGYV